MIEMIHHPFLRPNKVAAINLPLLQKDIDQSLRSAS
jgi:hypothetical protein